MTGKLKLFHEIENIAYKDHLKNISYNFTNKLSYNTVKVIWLSDHMAILVAKFNFDGHP